MTLAICQKCGAEKFGAFNECSNCGYCPMKGSHKDIALSVLYSDHYLDRQSLKELGRDIGNGVVIEINQEAIDAMTRQVANNLDTLLRPPTPAKKFKWWQFWKN